MLIDLVIIIAAISAVVRGREIGFVRQILSTVGFFGGLLIGAWLEPHIVNLAHSQTSRSLITLATTLGCAMIFLIAGELLGITLKRRLVFKPINRYDAVFGSAASVISLLFSAWLMADVVSALPAPQLQTELHNSRIVSAMDRLLPPAPQVIGDIGSLIDPNGFPQVFAGREPSPRNNVQLPQLGELQPAVAKDAASVVKVEGQGCGGIVEGSGFVIAPGYVVTNAHVVAGIRQPFVEDSNGTHKAAAVLFNPNLDLAVLKTANLAGSSLSFDNAKAAVGTPGAVLGFPGGGGFTAGSAAVMDEFTAVGRNIYDRGDTSRDIYELKADVIPGNSGGPLINTQGQVIGVVFAESTTYNHVGYALTANQVSGQVNQAITRTASVGTGSCAE